MNTTPAQPGPARAPVLIRAAGAAFVVAFLILAGLATFQNNPTWPRQMPPDDDHAALWDLIGSLQIAVRQDDAAAARRFFSPEGWTQAGGEAFVRDALASPEPPALTDLHVASPLAVARLERPGEPPRFLLFRQAGRQWQIERVSPSADERDRWMRVTRLGLLTRAGTLIGRTVGTLLAQLPEAGPFLLQRVQLLAWAGWTIAAAVGFGGLVLWGIGLSGRLTRGQRLVFSYGLGMAVLGLLTQVLGLLGGLHRWLFLSLWALGAGGAVAALARWRRLEPPPSARLRAPSSVWGWCLTAAVAALLLYTLLGAMTPPSDFDVLEYHLQGPKEYYQAGVIRFLPHNVYTAFPFGTEMLSLAAMVLTADVYRGALVGQTVLASFALATAVGLWSLGRRFFSHRAGALAAAFYLTIPWTYRCSIIAYAEGALAFYTIGCLYALLLARQAQRPAGFFLLVGLLAGAAAGCKYTAVVFLVGPMTLAGLSWRWGSGSGRVDVRAAGLVLAGAVSVSGLWFVRNWVWTGNPTYPLLYRVFGGRDWDPETDARWVRGHRSHAFTLAEAGRNLEDLALRSDWGSPLVFAFAPLAFVVAGWRRTAALLAVYLAAFLLLWFFLTHRIDRFWVALLPVWSLLAGAGAVAFTDVWWAWLRRGAISLVLLVNAAVCACQPLSGFNGLLYDIDQIDEVDAAYPAQRYVNRLAGPVRVLAVGEAAVFYYRVPILYNTVFNANLLEQMARGKPSAAFHAELHRQGITHILVNWAEIRRYRAPGSYGYSDFVQPALFDAWVRDGVLQVDFVDPERRDQVVYAVRPPA